MAWLQVQQVPVIPLHANWSIPGTSASTNGVLTWKSLLTLQDLYSPCSSPIKNDVTLNTICRADSSPQEPVNPLTWLNFFPSSSALRATVPGYPEGVSRPGPAVWELFSVFEPYSWLCLIILEPTLKKTPSIETYCTGSTRHNRGMFSKSLALFLFLRKEKVT